MNASPVAFRRPKPGTLLPFVLFSAVTAGAARLGPAVPISAEKGQAASPSAVIDRSGVLHIVWADGGSGIFDIFYRPMNDEGRGALQRISATPGLSSGPKVASTPEGRIYILWHDSTPPRTRIYLSRVSRHTHHAIVTPSTRGAFTPAVSIDAQGRLHIAWADKSPGNFDVMYGVAGHDGKLTRSRNLSNNPGKSLVPAITVDPCGSVYVAWYDNSSGSFEVYLRVSRDGGSTFDSAVNVSLSTGLSGAPALAAPACGEVQVVWPDATSGNFELMARRSADHGKSFLRSRKLTSTRAFSIRPALKTGPGKRLHLAWVDGRPDHFEVYYRCFGPDFEPVSEPLQISSGNGIAGAPSLDVAPDGTARVVWIDDHSGTFRVFMRKVEGCTPLE